MREDFRSFGNLSASHTDGLTILLENLSKLGPKPDRISGSGFGFEVVIGIILYLSLLCHQKKQNATPKWPIYLEPVLFQFKKAGSLHSHMSRFHPKEKESLEPKEEISTKVKNLRLCLFFVKKKNINLLGNLLSIYFVKVIL